MTLLYLFFAAVWVAAGAFFIHLELPAAELKRGYARNFTFLEMLLILPYTAVAALVCRALDNVLGKKTQKRRFY